MKNLSIGRKLALGFGVLVLILAISGGINYFQIGRINNDVIELAESELPLEQAVTEMEIAIQGTALAVLNFVRNHDEVSREASHSAEADFEKY